MNSRDRSRTVPNENPDDFRTPNQTAKGSSASQPFDRSQPRYTTAQGQTASKWNEATTSRKPQDKQTSWSTSHGPTYAADESKQAAMTQRMRTTALGAKTEVMCTGPKSSDEQEQIKKAGDFARNLRDSDGARDGGFLRLVSGYWPKVPGRAWAFDDIQDPGRDGQR